MFDPPRIGTLNSIRFWLSTAAVLLGIWVFVLLVAFVAWTLWQVYG